MFWCVSYYLGAFGTVFLPYSTQCKTGQLVQLFVPQSRVGIFRNERTRSTPLDTKLLFHVICTILVHLGLFGCLIKLGAERAEVVQKFMPRSPIGIFHEESTRSDPWTLNSCFGAFRTIWMHLGLFGCHTTLSAKRAELVLFRATKSRWNFS